MPFLDRAVGIDLGTTNSEIAWLLPSEREVVIHADRFGRTTIPSAVAWDEKEARLLVGHAARSRRGTDAALVESVKRRMGQRGKVALGPHALTPEEVSSKILAELRDRMRETLASRPRRAGAPSWDLRVTRAVITVPAYFDAPQIEATRRAGELAGLSVIGVLQEPTAAAIYHTWRRRLGDGTFLVYDLGGGTFDVSILRCIGGEYQVLAIDGDNYLGGDDFDRRYGEHLRKELVRRGYSLDLDVAKNEEDRRTFQRLVHLAQEIKELLSTAEVANVSKNDFMKDKAGESVSFQAEVGRADYERSIEDLVVTTIGCCERALLRSQEVASVGAADIDHVILVGGSTRVPLVVRRVTAAFCKKSPEPLRDDVDTCVALGAAIHAAHVGGTLIGDDQARVRVTTPLVAQGDKLRLGLVVEAHPNAATHLALWEGDRALAEAPLTSGTLRLDVSLGAAEDTQATLALQSSMGAPVVELPLTLHRGDLRPRPTALSRAAVVAKDIALEVVRGGRRERKVLLARGTGLPAQVAHRFFTADQAGAVVLRILQNRLPIKTLVVDVPKELPVGSAVELTLRCDETMRLEAQATVGTQQIQAQVEPPRADSDEASDVERLLERAEQAKRALWGSIGAEYAREADRLAVGIREALHTDPDKLTALSERLRHLVEEFHGGVEGAMVPPIQRMEDAFDVLRRVVYRAGDLVMGMGQDAWEKRIDVLYERAMDAHGSGDAPTWRRVFNEVQALSETAFQEEFSQMRLDDPAYIQRRTMSLTWRVERIQQALVDLSPSTIDDVRAMQLVEQSRLEEWLERGVREPLRSLSGEAALRDPSDARRLVERIDGELERIEAAVERLPSIGLVTDRGGA